MLDGVTLNQLRTFVAVADEASFSAAARQLRRAQSAVSHAIAALEQVLAIQLFERDVRKATLTAAGRSLLPDARAVIARTEEMKTHARSVAKLGAPHLSIAVDVYFPRGKLVDCLRALPPTATIDLRMTTMQGGEALLLENAVSLAVAIADVPELRPSAIERHYLSETPMVTVCAPSHSLAQQRRAVSREEFSRHIQLVVTDNQPAAENSQKGVASERYWLINDLSAKYEFLRAGLGWGHMPLGLVAKDLKAGSLVEIKRRAWHVRPLIFVMSRRRGHELSTCEAQFIKLLEAEATEVTATTFVEL
jgi:DNA-binding transcriptional LysR family regulator